ncbi:tetratricopeptide repeat protein [Hyphobacterium marinum]|uniref:Tetratricopeptide repeat protein n=1 Tax=Hyphobacterium marinum TaxID=3116574 RepID=A0ABU7M1S2_9PROT|nr:tetratricopeptide repeat protein [Hyphobacterium sp. Y6023]MEE2567769.1 tetratricopeptide repeat protein [Hyphobacterium sp. Y6023]
MSALLQSAAGLMKAGQFAQAERLLADGLATHPGDVEARHLRAMALGQLGRFDEGRAEFNSLAKKHPAPHAVLSNLGNLERRAGNLSAAAEAYRASLQIQPGFADAEFNFAIVLSETGDHEQAAGLFQGLSERLPDPLAALNGLGNALSALERHDAAIAAFDRALALRGDAVGVRINRAAVCRNAGRLAESLSELDRACREAPGFAEAHYQRGNTLRTLGRTEDARAAYAEALRHAPGRVDIHRELASLAWESGAGQDATAAMDVQLAVRPDPDLALAKARILYRGGDLETARAALDQALSWAPDHAEALALRGEIRRVLRDGHAGLEDLEAAFAASEGRNCAIRHQLVEGRLAASDFAGALALLGKEPEAAHLQKHVALKALAWRGLGDPAYRDFYDYDRFTWAGTIRTPAGYDSLAAFNAELEAVIAKLHTTKAQPLEQTLYGGTQSPGRLWNEKDPVIAALADSLLEAADRFVAGLPHDPAHPFLRRKSNRLKLTGAWSVRLRSGGGHVDHVHPAGWISACYYVAVPQSVLDGERAGWLRLGASGVRGLDMAAERYLKPEPGRVIFFPSYMWHGVEPFAGDTLRVTAPFDLVPD